MKTKLLLLILGMSSLSAIAFAQQRFDSPEAAYKALIDAAEKHDAARLAAMFGPQGNSILTSSNTNNDRADQSEFVRLARLKHELITDSRNPNRAILSVGDEDWPFPVPLVRSEGKWRFDASESKAEMQARRIGADELDVIEICAAYVQAQRKYASEQHDSDGLLKYASHMMSSQGTRNGLYWQGAGATLVPRELADATWDGQSKQAKPYHGYYFRILNGQGAHAPGGTHKYLVKGKMMGGFGLIAWPAQYGKTGIYTYLVNQEGVVYQKDIAPLAPTRTTPITRYDPDPSWTRVD